MQIAEMYSHKDGEKFILEHHAAEFAEIKNAIARIDAIAALCKKSDEKTKENLLFSPVALNEYLKNYLCNLGWTEKAPGTGRGLENLESQWAMAANSEKWTELRIR